MITLTTKLRKATKNLRLLLTRLQIFADGDQTPVHHAATRSSEVERTGSEAVLRPSRLRVQGLRYKGARGQIDPSIFEKD